MLCKNNKLKSGLAKTSLEATPFALFGGKVWTNSGNKVEIYTEIMQTNQIYQGTCNPRMIDVNMASTSGRTVAEISRVAKESIKCLGYDNILPEQETAIINFVRGHDVFVCLPTGLYSLIMYSFLEIVPIQDQ